jgi:hypothetical protein
MVNRIGLSLPLFSPVAEMAATNGLGCFASQMAAIKALACDGASPYEAKQAARIDSNVAHFTTAHFLRLLLMCGDVLLGVPSTLLTCETPRTALIRYGDANSFRDLCASG